MRRMNGNKTNKPNLWRVAEELSHYNDPYRTVDCLLSVLKSSAKNPAHSNQDFGLLLRDILVFSDQAQ